MPPLIVVIVTGYVWQRSSLLALRRSRQLLVLVDWASTFFRGLRQYDNNLLLAGAGGAALLALLADFTLGLTQSALRTEAQRRDKRRAVAIVAVIAALQLCLVVMQRSGGVAHKDVSIGSKDFTESALLAEIVAQMLEAKGVSVERKFELGGNLPHDALVTGTIDLYPEYTGTSYSGILHHKPIGDPRAVYEQVKREYAEKFGVEVSQPLGFENTFAILIRSETRGD